MVEMI